MWLFFRGMNKCGFAVRIKRCYNFGIKTAKNKKYILSIFCVIRIEKNMNKKISTEFAIAMIVIVAVFFASMFYIGSNWNADDVAQAVAINNIKKQKNVAECKSHYYDAQGNVQILGWKIGDDSQGGIIVQISKEDIRNLPNNEDSSMIVENNPKVDLMDPSDEIRNSLNNSNPDKPVVITVKGYADTCDSIIPNISLGLGSIVLKKS